MKAAWTHISSIALSSSLTASVLHSTSPEGGPYLLAKGTATRRVALTSLPKGFHMSEGSLLPPCQRGLPPSHCIEPSHLAFASLLSLSYPGRRVHLTLKMNACVVTQLSPCAQPRHLAAHLCTEGTLRGSWVSHRTQGCQRVPKALSLELKR